MRFFSVLALFALPLSVSATRITSDPVYDDAAGSLSSVACSDGPNGLLTKGYNVFGDLPTFPKIGGSSVVAGWGDPNCGSLRFTGFDLVAGAHGSPPSTGSCWNVTYGDETITVTVIDHADDGYNLSQEAMGLLECVGIFDRSLSDSVC